jgi:hypothetical protein
MAMKQYYLHLIGMFIVGFVQLMFDRCSKICLYESFYLDTTWTGQHLDNSGASPVAVTASCPVAGYGLRLRNRPLFNADTGDRCVFWESSNFIANISIITTAPFDGLPAGSDISARFVARLPAGYNDEPYAQYLSLTEIITLANVPTTRFLRNYNVDLVMTDPAVSPQMFQPEVLLAFNDNTTINIGFEAISLQ